MVNLKEIEERCRKATDGPWTINIEADCMQLDSPNEIGLMGDAQYYPWTFSRNEDWIFVAHSRTDLPECVKLLKEAVFLVRAYSMAQRLEIIPQNLITLARAEKFLSEVED